MKLRFLSGMTAATLTIGIVVAPVEATTRTWIPVGGTNDWWDGVNWTDTTVPQAGDDVVITNAASWVLLTNATPYLGSIIISNTVTLIFSNWDTSLSATSMTVRKSATVTCAGPFSDADMSNRVYLVCSNLTVVGGGQINVDSKGYLYSTGRFVRASGPGGGYGGNGGAHGGYGGHGGDGAAPVGSSYPCGDPLAPLFPGSGGGTIADGIKGGNGGGAVRIVAQGEVLVNGLITANGGNRLGNSQAGGGAGGSIFITCNTLAGTNVIQANGGMGQPYGGNGAGGRIAVAYNPPAQSNAPVPSIWFYAQPNPKDANSGYSVGQQGDIGTVYFPDTRLLTEPLNVSGQILISNALSWTTDRLTISNVWVRFPQEGFQLHVSNDVLVVKGNAYGRLDIGGSVLTNFQSSFPAVPGGYQFFAATSAPVLEIGGNLRLTNNASLLVFSAPTNGTEPAYGALVTVAGNMTLNPGCWVYPYSHWSNGASPLFSVRSLTIATNAGFNADRGGYAGGLEPGRLGQGPGGGGTNGWYGYGGSYGGRGGGNYAGQTYGSSNAPALPGSGGGKGLAGGVQGGFGGGLVRIEAVRTIAIDGTISANGADYGFNFDGGGSGGGIYLKCRKFEGGTNGALVANGGKGYNFGGGGGRIAVWRNIGLSPEVISNSVAGGWYLNPPGTPVATNGTIVWGTLPPGGTVVMIQ
jgi:hypothetical protein